MPGTRNNFQKYSIIEIARAGLVYRASLVILAILVPLGLVNIYDGHYVLAGSILTAVAVIAVNLGSSKRGDAPTLPFYFLAPAMTLMTVVSLFDRGIYGVFWVSPTVLLLWVVFPRRVAQWMVAAYCLVAVAAAFYIVEFGVAWRHAVAVGAIASFAGFFVATIEDLQAQMLELASKDALTGARNRRELDRVLRAAVDRRRRHGIPSSMLILDVDHFKRINDNFGHAAGDAVLVAFVEFIRENTRHCDELFRVGGEEFVVLLHDTPPAGASLVANKLLEALRECTIAGYSITMSVGIAGVGDGETPGDWTKRADAALYKAKNGGRNRLAMA
jgi:diguanylate cyclase (GGDEF)-like protein